MLTIFDQSREDFSYVKYYSKCAWEMRIWQALKFRRVKEKKLGSVRIVELGYMYLGRLALVGVQREGNDSRFGQCCLSTFFSS